MGEQPRGCVTAASRRRYRDRPMTWRALLGLVLGAATAALGALILGEYEFTGTLPWVAGPLFGLVVGEVVVGVGRSHHVAVAAVAAVLSVRGHRVGGLDRLDAGRRAGEGPRVGVGGAGRRRSASLRTAGLPPALDVG